MSDVWKYIQKVKNNNDVVISLNCQLCEAEYGVTTSTATLRRHLTRMHSSTYTSNNQPRQNTSYTFAEQLHITTKLAEWIAVDLQPFNIVEQEEFKQFVYTLDPRYVIPCRQTIKQEINSLFEQRKTNIKLEINSFTTKIALTTDIWSSKYNNTAFLGITMHYINNNWEIKKCLLDFIPIEGSHSGALILTNLTDTLQEFNISNRIISLTTDNGSNMLVCGRELANELEAEFSNLTFSHNRCAAHIINLAVKAGMKYLDTSIIKLRKFVIKIRNSQLLLDDIKNICKMKNRKFLMPILDVDTRWNATYLMIERQILIHDIIEILINSYENTLKDLYPTNTEWSKIMVYIFILIFNFKSLSLN
jgi:BED zinc finger